MKKTIIAIIKFYKQTMSPLWAMGPFGSFNSSCRFYPTCSDYAIDAIAKHGIFKGTIKSINRVLRCNPLTKPGLDEA